MTSVQCLRVLFCTSYIFGPEQNRKKGSTLQKAQFFSTSVFTEKMFVTFQKKTVLNALLKFNSRDCKLTELYLINRPHNKQDLRSHARIDWYWYIVDRFSYAGHCLFCKLAHKQQIQTNFYKILLWMHTLMRKHLPYTAHADAQAHALSQVCIPPAASTA